NVSIDGRSYEIISVAMCMMIVLIDEKVKCGDDVIVIDVTTTSEFREYALNVQKNIYSLMTTISPRIEREYK
ncbi:MAG: hypothetical protein LBN03_01765, partial [Bifidobacteriaceae bacterium]|nr:hypothetical protein [Bifidobacteriaceae bacterium]